MLDVLCPLINESDVVSNELLDCILSNILEPAKTQRKNACQLAKDLVVKCADTLEPYIQAVRVIGCSIIAAASYGRKGVTFTISGVYFNLLVYLLSLWTTCIDNINLFQFFNHVLILGREEKNLSISQKVYDLIYELNHICPSVLLAVLPQVSTLPN